jgi:hypothetical protein
MPSLIDVAKIEGELTFTLKDGRVLRTKWEVDPLLVWAGKGDPVKFLAREIEPYAAAMQGELERVGAVLD